MGVSGILSRAGKYPCGSRPPPFPGTQPEAMQGGEWQERRGRWALLPSTGALPSVSRALMGPPTPRTKSLQHLFLEPKEWTENTVQAGRSPELSIREVVTELKKTQGGQDNRGRAMAALSWHGLSSGGSLSTTGIRMARFFIAE